MEKLLRSYDRECMRMAMLKHEETFKEQVYELHRLYRIQKILMKSIESNRPNGLGQGSWNSDLRLNNLHDHLQQNVRTRLDLERPAEEYIAESDCNRMLEMIDESEIELTLGPASYYGRKKPATPHTSDSGPSFSSSSTESSHVNRTNCTTHRKTNSTAEQLSGRELGLRQGTDMTLGYQSGSKISIDIEEQLRQERLKQPPWLFQVVSLNMT
ncbi:hypothetical protein SLEP1_g11800 [Rubroshorea leprosula]|nr:hypothetical protein SLEP1_g11800 [Rubroshorea leprosula]